jgi:hypothetical protein
MSVVPKGSPVRSNDNTWRDVQAEVAILCCLDHPNVIKLKEFFVEDSEICLVTDLIQGAWCTSPFSSAADRKWSLALHALGPKEGAVHSNHNT